MVDGHAVSVGRPDRLPEAIDEEVDRLSAQGLTAFVVRRDGDVIGLVAVSDRVRPEAAATVGRLRDMGLDVAMVSGDRRTTAEAIASSAGIARVLAEVFPEGKVDEVVHLQAEGRRVVFVGDGINDAPALAQADVGIAVGTGTDVAIEAADVTLLGGGVAGVADAIELARRTYRVIEQNLFWAFAYNVGDDPAGRLRGPDADVGRRRHGGVERKRGGERAAASTFPPVVPYAGEHMSVTTPNVVEVTDADFEQTRHRGVEDAPGGRRPLGRLVRAVPDARSDPGEGGRRARRARSCSRSSTWTRTRSATRCSQAVKSQGIPTVVAFRDGAPVSMFIGAYPEQEVNAFVDQLLPTEAELVAEEAVAEEASGDIEAAEQGYREALEKDAANRDAGIGLGTDPRGTRRPRGGAVDRDAVPARSRRRARARRPSG